MGIECSLWGAWEERGVWMRVFARMGVCAWVQVCLGVRGCQNLATPNKYFLISLVDSNPPKIDAEPISNQASISDRREE